MRLVVQGSSLQSQHLPSLEQICGGGNFIQIAAKAYYLPVNHKPLAEVAAYCFQHALDYAFVADDQTLSNFGLAVMDMDSTLISIECIDEIADMCNLKPQVAAITESAMRGEIEFAESLRRRVALLEGLHESALQRVIDERLQLNPGAQQWIDTCKQHGITTLLVSGGFDFFAHHVQAMTGLDYVQANSLEIIDGKLTGHVLGDIVDAQAKADFLVQLREKLGLQKEQVIAIGDGANDLKMMAAAGVSIAYHAKPIVHQQATYALNHSGLDGVINLFTTV
jgi:phosphoserine phosphatase